MNLFTVNQVNQVYVATRLRTSTDQPVQAGDIKVLTDPDGSIYFKHYGKGGLTRSDLIDPKNIMSVSGTVASKMSKTLRSACITLNSSMVSSDKVTPVGQDFILRLAFNNYVGISPEDSQYWKYGMVHSVANMAPSTFYLKLAKSLAVNMSREAAKLVKVYVTTDIDDSSDAVEVTATSDITDTSTFSGTYVGVIVQEAEPDWILGRKQQKFADFAAVPTTVAVLNANNTYDDLVWGDVVYNDGTKFTGGDTEATKGIEGTAGNIPFTSSVINSKLAADYEYFFHGERGDQYRGTDWPNTIPTEYMVDPTSAYGYDFIQIHYAYVGPNEGSQKSEKDITILAPRAVGDSTASNLGSLASSILSAIQAVADPADSRYLQVPASATTGNVPKFTSSKQLEDSGKAASAIS